MVFTLRISRLLSFFVFIRRLSLGFFWTSCSIHVSGRWAIKSVCVQAFFCSTSSYSTVPVCDLLHLDEIAGPFRVYVYEFVFLPLEWVQVCLWSHGIVSFHRPHSHVSRVVFYLLHFGLSKAYLSGFLSRN